MSKDPGRLPQTTRASEPIQPPRRRPSRWALRLLWGSVAFALFAIILFVASLIG